MLIMSCLFGGERSSAVAAMCANVGVLRSIRRPRLRVLLTRTSPRQAEDQESSATNNRSTPDQHPAGGRKQVSIVIIKTPLVNEMKHILLAYRLVTPYALYDCGRLLIKFSLIVKH